ncbi:MAG: hypothetical protein A2Z34_09965 [Planctomycetes bacterium RBG_16_59_8]|nr:MAG: hypothetical protein A2Z34_09965 [Planctomycetes bacterium RBG_16_59_8]
MEKDIISMREDELGRLKVIQEAIAKRISQRDAATAIMRSERQIRRMVKRVREEGEKGIIHRGRGKPSARKIPDRKKERVLRLYREQYGDFGPTLATEKLRERDGIDISEETLRQWLIKEGLWQRKRKYKKHRQHRERKACFGEMIQLDGSHHDWLEGRGPKMVLMGYIDDATNAYFGRFYRYEGIFPAMDSFKRYIRSRGIPQAVYLDKHSTYKSPKKPETAWDVEERENGRFVSQFQMAMKDLAVDVIHANSPQAKGRIERSFLTLQDRLVKEMRLAGIQTEEQANRFLPEFFLRHNKRFEFLAAEPADLHRPIPKDLDLDAILCIRTQRRICNDWTIQYDGQRYQILSSIQARSVQVRETLQGKIVLTDAQGKRLSFKPIRVAVRRNPPVALMRKPSMPRQPHQGERSRTVPTADHPWKGTWKTSRQLYSLSLPTQ